MSLSLYDIDNAILDVIERGFSFDEQTGEVFFTADDLERLEAMKADKMDSIAVFIKNLCAEADALKAEEKALSDRRKQKERKAEKLKEYVLTSLMNDDVKRFETLHGRFSTRKSSRCIIDSADLVPDDYKRTETVVKVDAMAVKKAIKAGKDVPGAFVTENYTLQLK